jgi:hypothetical protein
LNSVAAAHYGGWSGPLLACEADARDMHALAVSAGYTASTLLGKDATRADVRRQISAAAATLDAGDTFLLTYSGYGGQVPDTDDPESNGVNEAWCLFDGGLLDDELYRLFVQFHTGVRVVVVSDSCHSGTVTRARTFRGPPMQAIYELFDAVPPGETIRYRDMPPEISLRTYEQNRAFYDELQAKTPSRAVSLRELRATVRLISSCQDNQLAADGAFNGLFTARLKRVWNGGKWSGNYAAFHAAIVDLMPPVQTPGLTVIGPSMPAFDTQKPFRI